MLTRPVMEDIQWVHYTQHVRVNQNLVCIMYVRIYFIVNISYMFVNLVQNSSLLWSKKQA